ncbi:TetR/AcrR family transcriptional regulator [Chondromyces apiculatus]|uniref:Transcriptional regulator, TetR family n=1 Tax=Chondromyces apiculatus DSM 436 TaxID=1192034 RepID=A0A017SZE0_9BACT|nr:TetR/AcrR family transcriptional regulator [Chondromyces apiculatus]EYF01965.1 Transcriptional regulator, TetR family [Chondromyces apiculatus DSM 436]
MCPRSAEQVEQLKDERRAALLQAARVAFARNGFAATKIADVAAGAGISHGLVYHYFPDKEALFAATVGAAVEGWKGLLWAAAQQGGTPWDRLASVCAQMMAGMRDEPEYLLIILHAHLSEAVPAPLREALKCHGMKVLEDLTAMIEEGQRAGQITPAAPEELASALLSVVQGMTLSQLMNPGATWPSLDVVLRLLKA